MTPSLEGWPTKAKEAPSPHEVRLAPQDTNPVFNVSRENSTVSKIFEKCVYKRVYSFLDKNNLIIKGRFGFRSGYSSNHTIVNVVESINP